MFNLKVEVADFDNKKSVTSDTSLTVVYLSALATLNTFKLQSFTCLTKPPLYLAFLRA